MKPLMIVLTALLSTSIARADCDSTIASTDKIGDVRGKLACLAQEVSKLRLEIETMRKTSSTTRIYVAPSIVDSSSFPNEKCKSQAVAEVLKRGGRVVETGENSLDAQVSEFSVSFSCASTANAHVIVAGSDPARIKDFANLLRENVMQLGAARQPGTARPSITSAPSIKRKAEVEVSEAPAPNPSLRGFRFALYYTNERAAEALGIKRKLEALGLSFDRFTPISRSEGCCADTVFYGGSDRLEAALAIVKLLAGSGLRTTAPKNSPQDFVVYLI